MKPEILYTADQSHSIRIEGTNITYHSVYGALQESMHVFIRSGLEPLCGSKPLVRVFEMGLGTGLNALLALVTGEKFSQPVAYEAVEAFPLETRLAKSLNYCDRLCRPDLQQAFAQIHESAWEKEIQLSEFFSLTKYRERLEQHTMREAVDVVFYDAFGPRVDPALWEATIFKKLFQAICPGGLLVTYCSAVAVQRALLQSGFCLEKLPGPPHKREILRATKLCSNLRDAVPGPLCGSLRCGP